MRVMRGACLFGLGLAALVIAACGDGSGDDGDDDPVADAAPAGCAEPKGTTVTHSATISADETWEGDGVTHSVPSNLAIASATVTIEACAIVSMGAGASITVRGDPGAGANAALIASGSPDRIVSFVRADPAEPWGILRGYDESGLIELHYTELHGGGSFGGQYRDPAIAMAGSSYAALPVGTLEVDHVLIDSPEGVGIYFDTNAAFTDDSTDLVIQGAGQEALVMTMLAVGTIPSGTYTGNGADEVRVAGQFNVFADLTIRNRLPVRIETARVSIQSAMNDTTPITLTLEPGVELRFPPLTAQPGAQLIFGGNGAAPDNKVGVLLAEGTEAEPIRFTSGAEPPAAGDWTGIWLDTAGGSRLDHVIIEYAGGANGISSANCKPEEASDDAALVVGDFEDQYVPPADLITNSEIRASAGHAINAIWVGPATGPNLTGNGNTLGEIAECAQTWNGVDGPEVCPMDLGCY